MTKKDEKLYKQKAQIALKENGMKVFQKDMFLLKTRCHAENFSTKTIKVVDYVMFEDIKTGKQYECYYGSNYYNAEKSTLWLVKEYITKKVQIDLSFIRR